MTAPDAATLARWARGDVAERFSPDEARALADHLTATRFDALSNIRHPDHDDLSLEIAELRDIACTGQVIGPDGLLEVWA